MFAAAVAFAVWTIAFLHPEPAWWAIAGSVVLGVIMAVLLVVTLVAIADYRAALKGRATDEDDADYWRDRA